MFILLTLKWLSKVDMDVSLTLMSAGGSLMLTFYGWPFADAVSQFWLLLFLSHIEPKTLPPLQPALPPFS